MIEWMIHARQSLFANLHLQTDGRTHVFQDSLRLLPKLLSSQDHS